MGHNISAILIKGDYSPTIAQKYDLWPVPMPFDLTLFWTHLYHTEYWQLRLGLAGFLEVPTANTSSLLLPNHCVVAHFVATLTEHADPVFAVIWTDYFGGMGDQCGALYRGETLVTDERPDYGTVNCALRGLGVPRQGDRDEFDTLGLDKYRSIPSDFLDLVHDYPDFTQDPEGNIRYSD
jgi:hypothetical protein